MALQQRGRGRVYGRGSFAALLRESVNRKGTCEAAFKRLRQHATFGYKVRQRVRVKHTEVRA
jgi:hypothetical protein